MGSKAYKNRSFVSVTGVFTKMLSNRSRPAIFIAVFALIGTALLLRSFAAISPNAKIVEAENFSSETDTTIVTDASASGSSYLNFDAIGIVPRPSVRLFLVCLTPSPTQQTLVFPKVQS
jgi:uncharacterized membrane protein